MRKKSVLLLSEGFGTGHTRAAHAVAVGLRMLSPGISTHVLELGSFLHPVLAPWIIAAYRKTVTAKPKLYGLMYRSHGKRPWSRWRRLALHRIFYTQAAEVIRKLSPDAIVCTHPFPNAVISRLKRAGLSIPLCTVITDYDAHAAWIQAEVNQYLVSTPDVKEQLLRRGIPPEAVQVTGIPVHPSFWEANSRDELRARFRLKPLPTVLVMGGGWGLANSRSFLHRIAAWRDRLQLIICFGRNEKALTDAQSDPLLLHEHIRLLGFTEEIDKWMDVADLLITKPGGMTITEALAKGIPMLFHSPIPGQEEHNLNYFTRQGFGTHITSDATIDHWFQQLTAEQAAKIKPRERLIDAARGPADCSTAILQLLTHSLP